MVVRRDFERLYRREEDPWSIGDAESERYDRYLDWLREASPPGGFGRALDLGAGLGAFTSRVATLCRSVSAVELSEIAVAKARARHPRIEFLQGDVRRLEALGLPEGEFDLIVASDVIAYLTPREADRLLRRIRRLLKPEGRLFLAAWSPGGRYFTPESLERLASRHFALLLRRLLPSGHAAFLGRPRFRDLVLTFDYETWQPVPEGKRVDWEETMRKPAERLMLAAEKYRVPLTFFVEMGEILYLRRHEPAVAAALEEQIRDARRRGHDLQLHLHPEWLPEASPRLDRETGQGWWDEEKNRMHRLPEEPGPLLARLKEELEGIVQSVDPSYRVRVFRAGKYRVQPHAEIFGALQLAGIPADSSVWHGGWSFEHRFDFRSAWSHAAPYFPSPQEITLPAPPAEEGVLEFPILSFDGKRFSLDGASAEDLFDSFRRSERRDPIAWLKEEQPNTWRRLASLLRRFPPCRNWSRLEREPGPERDLEADDTLVAIGHTKGDLRYDAIASFLEALTRREEVRFLTFSEAVSLRLASRSKGPNARREMLAHQVARESEAVLGEARNEAQSAHLQAKVPRDRVRVLDLGCGAGYWTKKLEERHAVCIGVDYGAEFLDKARRVHGAKVARCDFHELPFPDGSFDAIYADNVLEHSADPSRALSEIRRVLRRKGMLAAALPPDARDRRYPVSDHLWKTDRRDLEMRLRQAGFSRIRVEEVDTLRSFSMPPYPASGNAMLYVTAWSCEGEEYTDWQRAEDLMEFVYRSLDPSRSQESLDAGEILRGGHAWCLGYCAVLGSMAREEGIPSRFLTLEARDHPRGRGERAVETHELVELRIAGRWLAFDPMANRVMGGFESILSDPSRADAAAASRLPDERFRTRGYSLYCSSFFYERLTRFCRRESLTSGDPWHWEPVIRRNPRFSRAGEPRRLLLLTDHPEEDRKKCLDRKEAADREIWLRADLAAARGGRELFRRIRRIPEKRLEILSEDLRWHQQAIRLHLLGALAPCREKVLRDKQGREEPLGWLPLLTRQVPELVAGSCKAFLALGRMRVAAEALCRAGRRKPVREWLRRPASLLYVRSDLWRGLRAGGSVGHVAGMAKAFQREGIEVSFLAADPPAGIDPEAMPVHPVPPPPLLRTSRSAARFEHSFDFARHGEEAFRADPPGLIYHRFDEGSLAGVLLSRALGVPLVLEYNGSGIWIAQHWDRPLPHRRTFVAIERANLRQAHLIVTVSKVLREELLAKGVEPHRILVCPNGVDAGVFHPRRDGSPVRHRLGLEGKTVVGFLGTFGPWHGAKVLARAARTVLRDHPTAAFLFIGDGQERREAEEILLEGGFVERCRFPGLVPQEEAVDYLAACDLLVSPHVENPDGSRFFGSPTKLFEYMAMGKGIVASRLEQIGEVLEDGASALLVPPGDAAELAAGIGRLLRDPALAARLGAAARTAAVRRHTWEKNARDILDLVRFV